MPDTMTQNSIFTVKPELIIADSRLTIQWNPLSGMKYTCNCFRKTAFFSINDNHSYFTPVKVFHILIPIHTMNVYQDR